MFDTLIFLFLLSFSSFPLVFHFCYYFFLSFLPAFFFLVLSSSSSLFFRLCLSLSSFFLHSFPASLLAFVSLLSSSVVLLQYLFLLIFWCSGSYFIFSSCSSICVSRAHVCLSMLVSLVPESCFASPPFLGVSNSSFVRYSTVCSSFRLCVFVVGRVGRPSSSIFVISVGPVWPPPLCPSISLSIKHLMSVGWLSVSVSVCICVCVYGFRSVTFTADRLCPPTVSPTIVSLSGCHCLSGYLHSGAVQPLPATSTALTVARLLFSHCPAIPAAPTVVRWLFSRYPAIPTALRQLWWPFLTPFSSSPALSGRPPVVFWPRFGCALVAVSVFGFVRSFWSYGHHFLLGPSIVSIWLFIYFSVLL